ncbi:MAG: FAD-binding oxidoreductase [Gammaproteobacteria bacterium]|nr:FAD-binding oxidoreductase [Gammaproteobacteria bacterium]MDH5260700.1 FAD-binding oxidoreductase [Gammaproteobacteria bacterium]MDH5584206.1 FAD-binding oxidoreductase [Gammaproteobacteria bacterium]
MLLDQIRNIVGPKGWSTDADVLKAHCAEWRGIVHGLTPMVVSPASTEEVSLVVRACADAGVAIVPQGGNTSLCAGAIPDDSGKQIILSLARMNQIRSIDAPNFSMEVEAGCILQNVQRAAAEVDRHFALSLGAEGSCQIGGNLATNAGGVNVVRYGTARAQVLGLEAVLADGTVVSSLRSLRKDTAGYDLKQLFIGSEGTLGIITAATLKLHPSPGTLGTALVGIKASGDAVRLLAQLRKDLGEAIEAFELVSDPVFKLVTRHIPELTVPFDQPAPWYVLIDVSVGNCIERLETALSTSIESGIVLDAVIAKNTAEASRLWRMRHAIAEAERSAGPSLKTDIAVPISRMEEFLQRGDLLLAELAPEASLVAFGHVGDGNLHYNVVLPGDVSSRDRLTSAIYDLVYELGGSFSAEHGIGRTKRKYLPLYRGGGEIELMRRLKNALDPNNILNPGKVI